MSSTESKFIPAWVDRRLNPRRRWRRQPLFDLGAVLLGLLVIEGVSMGLFHASFFREAFPHGYGTVQLYRDGTVQPPPPVVPHPYLLYTRPPGYVGQYNRLGYRNYDFDERKPAGTLRILCLGGSTTDMYPYVPARDSTWVARLERLLVLRLGKPVQVINAGLPAATSAELLAAYTHRHRHLRPDWIIYHEGGNDVVPLLYPHYRPDYTHYRAAGVGPLPRPLERSLLASHLAKVLYAIWLNSTPVVVQQQPAALAAISADSALARVRRTAPEGLRRNLEGLLRLARADSARVLVVPFLQASAEKINATPGYAVKAEALELGLTTNLSTMRTLATAHGASWMDWPARALSDSLFQDNCHPTSAGEAVKARLIADALAAAMFPPARGRNVRR